MLISKNGLFLKRQIVKSCPYGTCFDPIGNVCSKTTLGPGETRGPFVCPPEDGSYPDP